MSKVTFVCSECEKESSVESNDYETETEVDEGGMGTRVEYWTEIETECECGNEIEIMLNDTEYPEGNFEGETVHSFSGVDSVTIG
ncbi:hypothetical protein [Providencia manganoxydans]